MQLPSSNERGMTWLTKLALGHLGCEAHASPRSHKFLGLAGHLLQGRKLKPGSGILKTSTLCLKD